MPRPRCAVAVSGATQKGRVASGAMGDPAQHVAVVRKRWDVRSGKAKNRAESPEGMEARSEAGLEGKIKGLVSIDVKSLIRQMQWR